MWSWFSIGSAATWEIISSIMLHEILASVKRPGIQSFCCTFHKASVEMGRSSVVPRNQTSWQHTPVCRVDLLVS